VHQFGLVTEFFYDEFGLDGLLINLDVIGNSIAYLIIWQMDSHSLTFRKNITDKQSFNRANKGSTMHTNKW
jgi:hypothetical protein